MIVCLLCGCKNVLNQTTNNTTEPNGRRTETKNKSNELSNKTNEYSIDDLLGNEIPIPANAEVKDNKLVITDSRPDEIIAKYLKLLSDNGWEQVNGLGVKRFFEKDIHGKKVTISVLSIQEGGPQEKGIETIIQLQIATNPE